MSLARRTLTSSIWSFGTTQCAGVLSFAVSIVAAHRLAPDALGTYALVTLIVTLVTAASSLQMGGYYVVAREASPRLLQTGFWLELGIGVCMYAAVTIGACVYGALAGGGRFATLLVLAASVLLTNPLGSLSAYFTRELRYRTPSLAQAFCGVAASSLKIGLLVAGAGIWGLVLGDVALSALFGFLMLLLVRDGRGFAFDRAFARKQLAFGVPSLATGLLGNAANRVPEAAVASVLGVHWLGIYYVATRIPGQVYQVGRSLSIALLPAFSRATSAQLERGFLTVVRLSALFVGYPLALFFALSHPFVTAAFGANWGGASTPLAILMAAVSCRFVLWHVGNLLKAQGRVVEMTKLAGAQLALLAPTCVLGSWAGGLVGAALAVLAVEFVLVPPRLRLVRSVVAVRLLRSLLPAAAAVVAGTIAGLLLAAALPDVTALVVEGVVLAVLFAAVLWLTEGRRILAVIAPSNASASKLQVLMVSRLLPPEFSGAGRQAVVQAEAVAATQAAAVTLLGSDPRVLWPRRSDVERVAVVRWPTRRHPPRLDRLALGVAVFVESLVRRYDVVHLHGNAVALTFLGAAKRLRGFTVAYKPTMSGKDDAEAIVARSPRRARCVDVWVCTSGALAESCRRAGIEDARIARVPNAVDIIAFRSGDADARDAMRGSLGVGARTLWLSVAAIQERKRQRLLVQAWALLPEPRPMIVLVGPEIEPGYAAAVRADVEALGLDEDVVLVGPREDVPELLAAADAFALVSAQEGLPNAVLEALVVGLPVVVSDFDGAEELARLAPERVTVAADDPVEIAAAIRATALTRREDGGMQALEPAQVAGALVRAYAKEPARA